MASITVLCVYRQGYDVMLLSWPAMGVFLLRLGPADMGLRTLRIATLPTLLMAFYPEHKFMVLA